VFITVEGLDGSGKSTQVELLASHLSKLNMPTVRTREPGGTLLGGRLRNIVLTEPEIEPLAEYLIFAADRVQHIAEITRIIEEGSIVLCDRYIGSSLAYQGMKGVSESFMLRTFYEANGLVPDITLWINTSPEVAKERTTQRGNGNNFDNRDLEYYRDLSRRYESLAGRFGWTEVDGNGSVDEVFQRVLDALQSTEYTHFVEELNGGKNFES
jgi:dTMP kinase